MILMCMCKMSRVTAQAQVEQDLAWARFLTGLHGSKTRREVSDLVSGIVEYGAGLQLTEDKLTNIMEAAQA